MKGQFYISNAIGKINIIISKIFIVLLGCLTL